mgnify:CR=1 FL=1
MVALNRYGKGDKEGLLINKILILILCVNFLYC